MILSFETVYKELEYMFIKKLPECIEKINKKHNDTIIIKPFENKTLDEDCLKNPSFKFKLEEAQYTEKDRIIENINYTFSLVLKLKYEWKIPIVLSRYIEAINNLINTQKIESNFIEFKILNIKNNNIIFNIKI